MSKKHGQLKEPIVRMVDEAMVWLSALKEQKEQGNFRSGKDRWLELVKTLRDITEGKVRYVERCRVPEAKGRFRSSWNFKGQG